MNCNQLTKRMYTDSKNKNKWEKAYRFFALGEFWPNQRGRAQQITCADRPNPESLGSVRYTQW
ncbi:hypothetical protein M7I_6491 [Glarea lozoyensis 74030]|uniref:Uncharacterized protein n=1 Tax=Glarea lozoyensis (strain ATCC 74030 / MF5533) TaxID=1104152 RepID=H0EUQ2_GLAL7|nr:hypothetical protein M7I_6491 [Glarea lozoyensis 74030]